MQKLRVCFLRWKQPIRRSIVFVRTLGLSRLDLRVMLSVLIWLFWIHFATFFFSFSFSFLNLVVMLYGRVMNWGLFFFFLNYVWMEVTMQAQKEAPADMQCKDKFLLQSVKTVDGTSPKDITADMVYVLC